MKEKLTVIIKKHPAAVRAVGLFLTILLLEVFLYFAVVAPKSESVIREPRALTPSGGSHFSVSQTVGQVFNYGDELAGVSIFIGTFEHNGYQGTLEVVLKDFSTGKELETGLYDLSTAKDNQYFDIVFSKAHSVEGGVYLLEVQPTFLEEGSEFWYWNTEDDVSGRMEKASVNGRPTNTYLALQPMGSAKFLRFFYLFIAVPILFIIPLIFLLCKKWSVTKVYILAAAVLGILYMIVHPPYGSYDEAAHIPVTFVRATQWASGNWDFKVDEETEIRTVEQRREYVPGKATVSQYYYFYSTIYEMDQEMEWVPTETEMLGYPYEYLPQILGVMLARVLRLGQTPTLYLAQFMALFFFVTLMALAIRNSPFPLLFFVVGLFPVTLRSAGSFSYDCFINGIGLLYLALILKLIYSREDVTLRQLWLILLLGIVLAPCKVIYVPVGLLLLLIPRERWKTKKKIVFLSVLFILSAAVILLFIWPALFWRAVATGTSTGPWENETYTYRFLLQQPLEAIRILGFTFVDSFAAYLIWGISKIQHIEIPLTVTFCFIGAALFALPQENDYPIKKWHKWAYFLIYCSVMGLGYIAAIPWTTVGSYFILGMQGRYMIPVFPLLFLPCINLIKPRVTDGGLMVFCCGVNCYAILYIFLTTLFV